MWRRYCETMKLCDTASEPRSWTMWASFRQSPEYLAATSKKLAVSGNWKAQTKLTLLMMNAQQRQQRCSQQAPMTLPEVKIPMTVKLHWTMVFSTRPPFRVHALRRLGQTPLDMKRVRVQ